MYQHYIQLQTSFPPFCSARLIHTRYVLTSSFSFLLFSLSVQSEGPHLPYTLTQNVKFTKLHVHWTLITQKLLIVTFWF